MQMYGFSINKETNNQIFRFVLQRKLKYDLAKL